jgi:hypothetical protein
LLPCCVYLKEEPVWPATRVLCKIFAYLPAFEKVDILTPLILPS